MDACWDSWQATLLVAWWSSKRLNASVNCTQTANAIRQSYIDWVLSKPFDIGHTTFAGLGGSPNHQSEANGSLMRISPLGVFGWQYPLDTVGTWARADAALTHPNPVCMDATTLFTQAIAYTVNTGCDAQELYSLMLDWARDQNVEQTVLNTLLKAADRRPNDLHHQPSRRGNRRPAPWKSGDGNSMVVDTGG